MVGWQLRGTISSFSPLPSGGLYHAELHWLVLFHQLWPALYNNLRLLKRMCSFVHSTHHNGFCDVLPNQTVALMYRLLDYQASAVRQGGLHGFFHPLDASRNPCGTPEAVAGLPPLHAGGPASISTRPCRRGPAIARPRASNKSTGGVQGGRAGSETPSRNYVEMKPENLAEPCRRRCGNWHFNKSAYVTGPNRLEAWPLPGRIGGRTRGRASRIR